MMFSEYFGAISIESIESVLNRMLSDFLNLDIDSPDYSRFFVSQFTFTSRSTDQYPVTFRVALNGSEGCKEFDVSASRIVSCLKEYFSTVDGAESMKFRTARINYEYPQYEGDAMMSMYCLLETTSDSATKENNAITADSAIKGW
jgi:hypothetical protein